jgi:SET domain-containing protein
MSNKLPKTLKKNFIEVQNSPIHGNGVFATENIRKGDCIIEYKGERISWKTALKRHPHDPLQPNHTFYFSLTNGKVIDGKVKGNDARWINHSCAPNCVAHELKDKKDRLHVFLFAKKNIKLGEELFYDYCLDLEDEKPSKEQKKNYLCKCGSKKCRGTMLRKK